MKRLLLCALVAWWFAAQHVSYRGATSAIGPFRTQQECEQVRAWVMEPKEAKYESIRVSWCWWDGKS